MPSLHQPNRPLGFSKDLPAVVATPAHLLIKPVSLDSLVDAAMARAERRCSGEEKPIATPWRPLNETLGGGIWPGAHFLVAGTGVGKSQLTFQLAGHAAKAGIPVGLIALELDEAQMVIRLAAEEAGVTWSTVYNGQAKPDELRRVKEAANIIRKLPITADFGQAMGWSSDRLELMAKTLREKQPKGPALIVLDFIQLVSDDEGSRPVDLRERIGRAGYRARNIARQYDVAVIVVSSTARANYEVLNAKMDKSGLGVEFGRFGKRRVVRYPDALIGVGKESGELEYSADSVTVLMRPKLTEGQYDPAIAEVVESGGKVVVCATVKTRASVPSWFALNFQRGRFHELPEDAINSLARSGDEKAAGRPKRDPMSLVRAVVEAVEKAEQANQPLKNKVAICERVTGTKTLVLEAIKTALRDGYVYSDFKEFRTTRKPLPPPIADDDTNASEVGNESEQPF